jgi:hypothetical protein
MQYEWRNAGRTQEWNMGAGRAYSLHGLIDCLIDYAWIVGGWMNHIEGKGEGKGEGEWGSGMDFE